MVRTFFWLAIVVTLVFFILAMVFAVLQWIIYFRIEQTTLNTDRNEKK
ncbi:hypothetical protein [Limosilactobacillus albertensis]|uniref:Uncharacterized protein n=1 Tax=Limosilactobacillus albertensis TaxID=2759752 RepID=A0A839HC37_9LACO|nr:hypothetical protein [Limosilactobacillus albertensis]MBB1123632.1 hypothetical protein [Limosilactobacillus albertensis]MCD7123117.1 hypothetical protein [Limosilactobacillus albertensis]